MAVDSVVSPVVRGISTVKQYRDTKALTLRRSQRVWVTRQTCTGGIPLHFIPPSPPPSPVVPFPLRMHYSPQLLSNMPSVLNYPHNVSRSTSSPGISQPIQIGNQPSPWGTETGGSQPELYSEIPSQHKMQTRREAGNETKGVGELQLQATLYVCEETLTSISKIIVLVLP